MSEATVMASMSQPQHTPAGRLVGVMYYRGFLSKALNREEYSGYPHNGGEHTLVLHLVPSDLNAFLDLVRETFKHHEGMPSLMELTASKLHQRYPGLTLH
jgi:hypothetical protein